jgi:hypothetical protein
MPFFDLHPLVFQTFPVPNFSSLAEYMHVNLLLCMYFIVFPLQITEGRPSIYMRHVYFMRQFFRQLISI